MYFLRLGNESIVGASPEMLVRCRGPRLDYRPIAGTRPRGATKAEDRLLASEMRSDEKEVAEHMMLVDLGRNDLGRVADYGSVQLEDLMRVECYSHVQHLVSSLHARLRGDLDRFDAFGSCFPAGTVTGAPKVRAMEIISQLEPDTRGIYAGAMLYADYSQNLDSCIAIRTIVMRDGKASVQAGAGIVADSVPESEYEETINKAKAMFRAIEIAEKETERNQHSNMILVIDNYDSFTYNLVQYLGELGEDIVVRRNDKVTVKEVEALCPDRILISPGPGTPDQAGVSLELISRFAGRVPILGVCLGHQAIGQAFGGYVGRAPELVHGKASEICHDGKTIFAGPRTPLQSRSLSFAHRRTRVFACLSRNLCDHTGGIDHGSASSRFESRRRAVSPGINLNHWRKKVAR